MGHQLAWFDKAPCSHDILRPTPVLLEIKLLVEQVLIIHAQLKLQHATLLDKAALVEGLSVTVCHHCPKATRAWNSVKP